jgi:hypothetical protein
MQGEVYQSGDGFATSNLFANALSYVASASRSNETYLNLEATFNNTVIMMSQGVRQLPVVDETGNYTWYPANGTVYQYDEFYQIQFYYLGATHFVVGGSLLFFVLTVFLTRTEHPWKTSSLPLVFHGLTAEDRNRVGELPEMVDMRMEADKMKVKLAMTGVGQRFVTRETVGMGR